MIAAIVLAAGRSSRFGRRPKLLQPIAGQPLLAHTLDRLAPMPIRPLIVVTGRAHQRLAAAAYRRFGMTPRLRVVRNRAPQGGMASSLRHGLRAVPPRCDHVLVVLGDMPAVTRSTIAALCRHAHSGIDVVRPMRDGQPGHPVLLSRRLFGALANLDGDRGARRLIETLPAARRIQVTGRDNDRFDIDTPRALRRHLHHRAHGRAR